MYLSGYKSDVLHGIVGVNVIKRCDYGCENNSKRENFDPFNLFEVSSGDEIDRVVTYNSKFTTNSLQAV